MNRVSRVARVYLTHWLSGLGWPLVVLSISFVLNLAFYASLGDKISDLPNARITGGLASVYTVVLIVSWQGIMQLFSFTVGLNVTRRAFSAATGAVVIGQCLFFGALLYLLELVEHATNGWGIRLAFFDPIPPTHGDNPAHILVYAVPMLVLAFTGSFFGAINKRWGANGVYGAVVLGFALAGLVAVTISGLDGWPAVGDWVATGSGFALLAGWALIPAVLLAGGAYGVLRRAIP